MIIRPYTHKVQYYETDQMGIVHHSNYIRWFEEARVDCMEQLGYGCKKAADSGVDFAVLSVFCEYKSMTRFGDFVNVGLDVTSLTPTRITLKYTITDSETGELRATGETGHCCYHNIKKRPVSLKKELPELYRIFDGIKAKKEDVN